MKKLFLTLTLALLSMTPLMAQDAAPATNMVATALADSSLPYISGNKPAADAKFYIYLSSASWCGPCRAIMPRVVQQYPEIKAAGGEIVLLCCDSTPAAGKAYLKKYDAQFPTILLNIRNVNSLKLPGFTPPRSIPNAVIVTADGTVLKKGHGSIVLGWREIIAQAQ